MKVAIVSESPADQAAIHIFVSALLGQDIELLDRSYRMRGSSTVFRDLPAILKELHFNLTDVEGLAVVMDSDKSPVHIAEHDAPGANVPECRLCKLRSVVAETIQNLKPVDRQPLRIAIGLAVPSIEAWLRCGVDNGVTQAAWIMALAEKNFPFDNKSLKLDVYGTVRPSLELETRRMTEEAQRIALRIDDLQTWFPNGFGPFAQEIRSWRAS